MKPTETHQQVLKALRIGKVKITKEMRDSEKEAIKAFKEKYNKGDKSVEYKLKSITASQGLSAKQIKKPPIDTLQVCSAKRLSLNMVSDDNGFSPIGILQKNLAYLGYKIYVSEHQVDETKSLFGKSTLKAVKAFQKDENLPQTGIFDASTRKVLNDKILKDRPKAKILHPYRIRGSVRDIEWRGKGGMRIEVSEKPPFDEDRTIPTVIKNNLENGFFDITYDAPIDEITGAVKRPLNIVVKLYEGKDTTPISKQIHHNVSPVHWVNFVQNVVNIDGNNEGIIDSYRGKYKGVSEYENILKELNKIEKFNIKNISENLKEEILALSKISKISSNQIMTILYAIQLNDYFKDSALRAELFYAFLQLNNHSKFSGNLFKTVQDIPKTVEALALEIALLDEEIKKEIIAEAIRKNLVSQNVKINTNFILKKLSEYQIEFTLHKNILKGEVSLSALLDLSEINRKNREDREKIALTYISIGEFSKTFWEKTEKIPNIKSFRNVVEIGSLVDNNLKEIKKLISKVKKASDIAKLSSDEIDAKVVAKAEALYPAVSLISHIKKLKIFKSNIEEIEDFIDGDKVDFQKDTIDESLKIAPDLKIIQRVHKITPKSELAVKLLENNIHNAQQIYTMGTGKLTTTLDITADEADELYESAKMRHMQTVSKILSYQELFDTRGFAVIPSLKESKERGEEDRDEIATLKALFGSMDYCECEHCQSLYGATAYLTDILNFLEQQPALAKNKNPTTAKEILFERRPDIGKITLNCKNTLTPVPYIDLVSEILENYILEYIGDSFSFHEEAIQTYLNYLQVPKYTLLETLNHDEIEIDRALFGITEREKNLIIENSHSYWDKIKNVDNLIEETALSYEDILMLEKSLYLDFKIVNEGCSLADQKLKKLVDKEFKKLENRDFVKIDSFVRLWRHTSWDILELDALIIYMNENSHSSTINEETLKQLRYIKQMQEVSGLSVTTILSFLNDVEEIESYMPEFLFFLTKIKKSNELTPKTLFMSFQEFSAVQGSPLSLLELEYSLNSNSDSVIGLRDETIEQMVEKLKKAKESEDIDSSIKLKISEIFDLEYEKVSILIESNQELLRRLKDDTSTFEALKDDYTLLHKNALLISKMDIEAKELKWFIENNETMKTFNFNTFNNGFEAWYNFYILLTFKNSFPEPENASLIEILTLAKEGKSDEAKEMISTLTQRDVDDILDGSYREASFYQQLLIWFSQKRVLNVDLVKIKEWTKRSDKKTVEEIGELIDKKNLDLLNNEIKEKKRTALVEYLLSYSQQNDNSPRWSDSSALYEHFLIDVEMSACQMTSRIKEALSAVQLFVQRCFLNLESSVKITKENREDKSSLNSWSQWKWMKNYRVWEANRKIFFYPENWLEPELRSDKSEIFKTLESALMQNEITNEHVEEVFANYLHELDALAHLEVSALYHEKEDSVDRVHVIARTKALPHIYYYRTYNMGYSSWSSWEKLDIEIDGDTLVPVVYNRKLHLFWLQFIEKPIKSKKIPEARPTDEPTDAPEARKVLEIQLVWSVKNSNSWSTKKISKQKLIHPWSRPKFSYLLKPNYKEEENELYINIYLSTSEEFNGTKFYDPTKRRNSLTNPTYITGTRFNENYKPWHASSFVFNGNVKEIKFKGLGNPTWNPNKTDSYDEVSNNFGEDGKAMIKFANEHEDSLKLPTGMHYHYNYLTNNMVTSKNRDTIRVLSDDTQVTLWKSAQDSFRLIVSQQDLQLDMKNNPHPFFYQDSKRAFFIEYKEEEYRVSSFYHPYTTLFIREFNRDGIRGLFNRDLQLHPEEYSAERNTFNFKQTYKSDRVKVDSSSEHDIVDFKIGNANAIYNWELFFHAPLLIATKLMQNQKFEEAMNWFHYIFNPTTIDGMNSPQRFWITKPFYESSSDDYQNNKISKLLSNIDNHIEQLKAWKNNPFDPYVIANYRTVAFQKNVVMKYVDNLIAWGDMLFRRDSIESINEASMLYILAYEILGKRPTEVKRDTSREHNYNDFGKLDAFANAIEDRIASDNSNYSVGKDSESLPNLTGLGYFCTPHNEKITQYWNRVEDRLFKIRHCMNIKGIVRQLPLFQPPIDPALLVKARAAGLDIGEVLSSNASSLTPYRFRVTFQKAVEFTSELKQLGDKLLSILEKKDAEELALFRSGHEIQLLEAVTEIRKRQIDEAKEQIKILQKNKTSIEERHTYYADIEKVTDREQLNLDKLNEAHNYQKKSQAIRILASYYSLMPDFHVGASGFGGSPHVVMQLGGSAISKAVNIAADILNIKSSNASFIANNASILGSHNRRYDDWKLQERLAKKELESIEKQIVAAEIREDIAKRELKNHTKQIENAKSVKEHMQNKFTNQELYDWMRIEVSNCYFQAYKLAYSMAKKAEQSYIYELGVESSNIIQGAYWDSLHKGLLSGEKLMGDLRRLEQKYMMDNRRGFEITKHISFAQLFPEALMELKGDTHTCTITLPEWLFDMDYPSHSMRRIKSVSLSIPCIVGPYTNVNCTLTLNSSKIRKIKSNSSLSSSPINPNTSSIVTSSGQSDSGMFELNFHDERYLPFEGAGVVDSSWSIDMNNNYFDFNSLSDVIMHINYVALDDKSNLRENISTDIKVLFNLKEVFPTEWHRFKTDTEFNGQFEIKPEYLPFILRPKSTALKIEKVYIEENKNLKEKDKNSIKLIDGETNTIDINSISNEVENIYIIFS